MKKWPIKVLDMLSSIALQKDVRFELFDKETNQVVFTSERSKLHLPGMQIINVKFSI